MRVVRCFYIVLAVLSAALSYSFAASLLVRSNAPGGSVSIDSGELGVTDEKGLFYTDTVAPGKYRLVVSKRGYRSYVEWINVKERLTTVVDAVLRKSDNTPPKLKILSPSLSRGVRLSLRKDILEITGLAGDENGIHSVSVNGDDATLVTPNEEEKNLLRWDNMVKFTMLLPLETGDNTIEVRVTDEPGNETVNEYIVTREGKDLAAALDMSFYALLIGIDEYDHWEDLVNPVNDILTLAKELKENYDFQTEILVNVDKKEIIRKIRSYSRKYYSENSELLIVMSGHGYFDEFAKTGYFVPSDGLKPSDDPAVMDSYIAYPILQNTITNSSCPHILLVLDACHGGTFNARVAMRGDDDSYGEMSREEFIRERLSYKTRLLLSSGGKEYVPDGRPGEHSPFMRKFLEALRNCGGQDGILTVQELVSEYMAYITPQPCFVEFEVGNEPGSSFLFIVR